MQGSRPAAVAEAVPIAIDCFDRHTKNAKMKNTLAILWYPLKRSSLSFVIVTIGLMLFLPIAPVVAQEVPDEAETEPHRLKEEILSMVKQAINANDIPAVSIGIVRKGEIWVNTGFGRKKIGEEESVDERNIYQIGSLSKMFTGIIVKNLIAEGKLNPQVSVLTFLPNTLSTKAKEKLANVTLDQLLRHRSGIRSSPPTNRRKNQNAPLLVEYTEADMVRDLNRLKSKFEPDEDFNYSNYGYAIIGYICERVSGLEFAELLRKYVSEKYGLPNTCLDPTPEQSKWIPTPYQPNKRNKPTQAWRMGKLSPAGGIYSTTGDLLALMRRQIQSYREPAANAAEDPLVLTKQTDPIGLHYGYGLYKNVKEDRIIYFHGGDLDGFSSVYMFYPERNIGLILLTSSGGSWIHYDLTDRIMDKLIASAL